MSTQDIVPEVLSEFLEVAVHNIIQARKIYPDCIFKRNKKYGVVVYKSIHPDVNNYITECIKTANHLLKRKQLFKFVVCFIQTNIPEEKFVFDVVSIKTYFENDPYLLKLEQNLRSFCLTLHSSIGYLKPLPPDTNFNIQIYTTEQASLECMENPMFEEFPWITINETNELMEKSNIIPVHTTDLDFMKLQVYIRTGIS